MTAEIQIPNYYQIVHDLEKRLRENQYVYGSIHKSYVATEVNS